MKLFLSTLLNTFIDHIPSLSRHREWIKDNLVPSAKARYSIYAMKHKSERAIGPYITESRFRRLLMCAGYRIEKCKSGDKVFAAIVKETE